MGRWHLRERQAWDGEYRAYLLSRRTRAQVIFYLADMTLMLVGKTGRSVRHTYDSLWAALAYNRLCRYGKMRHDEFGCALDYLVRAGDLREPEENVFYLDTRRFLMEKVDRFGKKFYDY